MLNYKEEDIVTPKKYLVVFLVTLLNKITEHLQFCWVYLSSPTINGL